MIFRLNHEKDELIERAYKEGLKKLNSFFNFKFKKGKIEIFLVKDRKMINLLRGKKTESWVVAWINGTSIYLLDKKNFEKESCHKYSDKEYFARVIHEMCHVFYKFVPGFPFPLWLNEGVSIFLSGQNKFKEKPLKFSCFLKDYNKLSKASYNEGGFFIEFLIKKFGKKKLIELIKSPRSSEKEFSNAFKKIYGFDLSYKSINEQYIK